MTDHSVHAPCPQCNRLRAYMAQALASFERDPADTDYQEGYKAALIVIRDEAFTSNDVAPCPPEPGGRAASYKVTEIENYRLALAWISKQSVDPKSRELASEALEAFEDSADTSTDGKSL